MGTEIRMPTKWEKVVASGEWLNTHMPNPPLPETQRFTIYNSPDGHVYIEFADEQDAIMFSLACSG